jgi:molybdenum cofactor biosynthesis enzyme
MDVSEKPITARTAIAQGQVRMKPETLAAISALKKTEGTFTPNILATPSV